MSSGGAARSSWRGMTKLGNLLNFFVGTVEKEDKVNLFDMGKITYGKIPAYNLVLQSQQKTRTQLTHPDGDKSTNDRKQEGPYMGMETQGRGKQSLAALSSA